MTSARRWLALAALVTAARLCHSGVLWVEEAYPAAAAVRMLHGAVPYRDFFFDKPPLAPLVYLAWGALPGAATRLAGAAYVLLCAWLALGLASKLWSDREGWLAAGLTAFFLTFYVPAATIPLAPDLLMVAPHLAAMRLLAGRRPLAAGAMAGAAMAVHTKGLFVLAALLAWSPASIAPLLAGFAGATALPLLPLAAMGALNGYWEQVWVWGSAYASDPLYANPWTAGAGRTANWLGFHAALAVGAAMAIPKQKRLIAWIAIALAGALLGGRFFPRYYFLPLVPLIIAASGGLARGRARYALLLLLIPLIRFGPRYVQLAAGGASNWSDTAMARDSHEAALLVAREASPGATIFVWGYRPEILWESRLRVGAPFLDSQPLTGVLADRHLTESRATFPALAEANRRRLRDTSPDIVVDGLGPANPALAIGAYPDLREWLAGYRETGRTPGSIVYRRIH